MKVKECHEIEPQDVGRLGIAQDILRKSMDFLKRIIAPIGGVEVSLVLSYVCSHCHCFPLEDDILWVSSGHCDSNNMKKKQCNWWCAACGGQCGWRVPSRVLVIQDSTDPEKHKYFEHTLHRKEPATT